MLLFLVNESRNAKIRFITLGELVEDLMMYYNEKRIIKIINNEDPEYKIVFEYTMFL